MAPFIGAIIADAVLGRYKTIMVASLVCLYVIPYGFHIQFLSFCHKQCWSHHLGRICDSTCTSQYSACPGFTHSIDRYHRIGRWSDSNQCIPHDRRAVYWQATQARLILRRSRDIVTSSHNPEHIYVVLRCCEPRSLRCHLCRFHR